MIYSFVCDPESGGCGESFEISCYISEYDGTTKNIRCPRCGNKDTVIRDYLADKPHSSIRLSDTDLTVGHLAKRNNERMSDEEKAALNYKHNKYRFENENELPSGMSRYRKLPEKFLPVKTSNKSKRKPKRRNNVTK